MSQDNLQTVDPSDVASSKERGGMPGVIDNIAWMLHPKNRSKDSLTNGERAELRRSSLDQPVTPTLWKVLFEVEESTPSQGMTEAMWERRWASLLVGMSYCAGLHSNKVPLGEALAESGWSEVRFVRLMEAKSGVLPTLVRRMSQYLASKHQSADWYDVHKLLCGEYNSSGEDIRLDISRAYFKTLHKMSESGS